MAARSPLLPFLVAALVVAVAFAPLAVAQGSGCADALEVRTDRASYPPGTPVRLTVTNRANATATLTDGHFDVWTGASAMHRLTLNATPLAPGAAASLTWDTAAEGPASAGTYDGVLLVNLKLEGRFGTDSCLVRVNAGSGFVLQSATPQPAPAPEAASRLFVQAGSGTFARGEAVTFLITNVGDTTLTEGGCLRFTISDRSGTLVYDARVEQPFCTADLKTLAPREKTQANWPGTDANGQPPAPGMYRVEVTFGGATGNAWFLVGREAGSTDTSEGGAVGLRLDLQASAPGAAVVARLTNTGTSDAQGFLHFEVRDAQGRLRHSNDRTVTLAAGATLNLGWTPSPNDVGTFTLHATLAGAEAKGQVTLSAATPSPAPEPASPPNQPPPPGGEVRDDTATTGQYEGRWVSFRLDAKARALLDVRVLGERVLERLDVPGSGALVLDKAAPSGEVRAKLADGVVVSVHDSPAAAIRIELPAGGVVPATLDARVQALLIPQGALLRAPQLIGLALVMGDGSASLDGSSLRVAARPVASDVPAVVMFRFWAAPTGADAGAWASQWGVTWPSQSFVPAAPGPAPPPEPTGPRSDAAAVQIAVGEAIATQRVGAEAFLEAKDGGVTARVVSYTAAELTMEVVHATEEEVTVEVDVASHEGRTLMFHLDAALAARLAAGLQVRFDGAPAAEARGLQDVLDPDDDGLAAEWLLVEETGGSVLLVSVPHFSVHTVSIASRLAEVLPSLAPYGAAVAMGAVLVAAVVLVRRSKD